MRKAFSLVELSIVLVILGLLVGGILAGKSLIHAAELRRVTSDINRFQTAIQAFRDKYLALPGDLSVASKFWSGAPNGNSDGLIYAVAEHVGAWNHLTLAGLIEGSYDGIWDGSGYSPIGSNAPAGPLNSTIWGIQGALTTAQAWAWYQKTNNSLILTGDTVSGTGAPYALIPEDAWNLDTKMDDGLAQYGKFVASGSSPCVNNSNSNPPNPALNYFNLAANGLYCNIRYYF